MSKYEKISKNIEEVILTDAKARAKIKWLNIVNAGKEEIDYLRKMKEYDFDFHNLRAASAKSSSQRPLIEHREKYFFIILHFPVFRGGEVASAEIDFFISHGLLITSHAGDLKVLDDFFRTCKKDEFSLLTRNLPSSSILLYELLSRLISHCYDLIDQNSVKIDEVEKIIFSGEQKKAVSRILELKSNVINIRRIMMNHKNILKKIMEMKSSLIAASQLESYYISLIEQTKRIWEFSDSQKETIEALHDTNESLLNYQTNNIIKILTIVSIIFAPLTLIASLFGSNFTFMPLIHNQSGFFILNLILLGIALTLLTFFMRRKWL